MPEVEVTPARELLRELTEAAPGLTGRATTQWPEGPWSGEVGSIKGQVAMENQDYGLALCHGDCTFLAIADGCGGVSGGKAASFAAVRGATAEVLRQLAFHRGRPIDEPLDVVQKAFEAAAAQLRGLSQRLAIPAGVSALRTTLILVFATQTRYGWLYIGDGGLVVLRRDGRLENLLHPHKDPAAANILDRSLGPTPHGLPATGTTPRCPGDLLMAGSDGVFDHVEDSFPWKMRQILCDCAGDTNAACFGVLGQFASCREAETNLFPFDDNLTLALLPTGALEPVQRPADAQVTPKVPPVSPGEVKPSEPETSLHS
ncbi:MAG: protein phosphatase 2C domain-containing protein [Candidatus Riflebacteria bacterium]|nr:protein phosphatase 2C domain-containing protein [Candidatus Riflebacteria bacterium]